MNYLIKEDFNDLELKEFPYDRGHTALGEYHHIVHEGIYGNWYDPIALHQWRSLDGSWIITSANGKRYLEQNRGDNTSGAFKNVYCCLVNKKEIFSNYTLEFDLRLFELKNHCGMAFNYITSRNYYFIGLNEDSITLFKRYEETFVNLQSKKIVIDDQKTYHIKIKVCNHLCVYLDEALVFETDIILQFPHKVAVVAKSASRYSDIVLSMTDIEYKSHLLNETKEKARISKKQEEYPRLKLINKIKLGKFGSGRQLRITRVENEVIFILAQHQKRMIRDSFAHLSSMTAFKIDGSVLWTIGEPNNHPDNCLISCDLPFQIADINNDGRKEVIYASDFEVRIIDLLTGKLLRSMPTPILKNDPLIDNYPFYRLNVDAIRVADFEGLGYKGDFIIKDRYRNVWAYNNNMELIWRYHNKNTGHFPYIYDFDGDGKDEMFVGYDLVDHNGKIIFDLPMNSDHTDEIIYARLHPNHPKRLILASGNEGMNIVNMDGTIFKHNEIGHAQRISVAKYNPNIEGLQICASAFWGSDGIICMYDCNGNILKQMEMQSNGSVITPVSYDGKHILALLHSDIDGGLVDYDLDKVVQFPLDNHPTLCCEAYDIDDDGIDEIICWDLNEMWIYKAEEYSMGKKHDKYPDDGFSNYRGEYLL
ncbi:MAG: hypothetical protein ACI35S_07840 [Anaeroplasma sp.]